MCIRDSTWTVKIRDGVSFTDGEKLTAKDVAFTYNTLKSTSSVNDFTMLDSVQAVDDTTVVFHKMCIRDRHCTAVVSYAFQLASVHRGVPGIGIKILCGSSPVLCEPDEHWRRCV